MGIKWDDVRILHSLLTNKIYLGKVKPINPEKGTVLATDRSGDKTDEILRAVMDYMNEQLTRTEGEGNSLEITCKAGRLIWERAV